MICLDGLILGVSEVRVQNFNLLPPDDFTIDESGILRVKFPLFPETIDHPKIREYQANLQSFLRGDLKGDLSFILVTTSRTKDCVLNIKQSLGPSPRFVVIKQSEDSVTLETVIFGDYEFSPINKIMCE